MPYHIQYAKSSRAKCKGPKKTCPVADRSIKGGALRLGSEIEGTDYTGVSWRHWKCTTPTVLEHMAALEDLEEDLKGFTDLDEEDQERVRKAIEEGHVSETEGDDEEEEEEAKVVEKPKGKAPAKKAAATKKKNEGDQEKPKKTAKKETEDEEKIDAEKPEPKKRGRKPKAATTDNGEASKPAALKRKETTDQETTAVPAKKRASKKTA